jgi:hypothetical protein
MTKSDLPQFPLKPGWIERPGADWSCRVVDGTEVKRLVGPGVFDELVVDHWLHLEQMDDRRWWLRVGDAWMMVNIDATGRVTLDVERGSYAEVRGETGMHPNATVADPTNSDK